MLIEPLTVTKESWFRLRINGTPYGPESQDYDRDLATVDNEVRVRENYNKAFHITTAGSYTITVEWREGVGRHEVGGCGGIFHRFGDCGADFRCPVGCEFAEIFFEVEEQRIIVAVEPLHSFQSFFIERTNTVNRSAAYDLRC